MRSMLNLGRPSVRTALIGAMALGAFSASATDAIPSPLVPAGFAGDAGEVIVAGVRTQLDPTLYQLVKESAAVRLEGFTLGKGLQVDLDLEQFDILTPDALLIVADGQNETATARPDMVMLRGTVVGDESSLVFLTLSPHGTNGIIRSQGGQFVISSVGNGSGDAYVYDTRLAGDVAINNQVCQGGLPIPGQELLAGPARAALSQVAAAVHADDSIHVPGVTPDAGAPVVPTEATTCRTIRMAIDTDWEYRTIAVFGTNLAAQTYAITLYGAISEVYRRDVNISLSLPYIRIWSANTDPYPTGSSIGDRLGQFMDHWRATKGGVTRDIANMLSGTSGGGVAYLGVLCNNTWGYGANGNINGSFPLPVVNNSHQNWDLMVCAHELGHNFNAPHTHDMNPIIDGCGLGNCAGASSGTIMSYCHTCAGGMSNIVVAFHPRTINEAMLPYLAGSAAACGPVSPSIDITSDPAFHTARAGTTTQFTVAADGGNPKTYAWKLNGNPVVDGLTPGGGVVSGATTATLTIASVSNQNAGPYSVLVANSCSSELSATGDLVVRCASDTNEDGTVDLNDFFEFFNCFDTSMPCADMDSSGVVDLVDFFAYLNAFDANC